MNRLSIFLVVLALAATCLQKTASAEEASGIPDEIVKQLDGLVGTWKAEGKIGDKQQTGEFTLRWERTDDKKKICLFGRFLFVVDGKESRGVTLIGWNAGKQCIEDRGFDANGGNGILYWKIDSPTLWKGELIDFADGKTVTGEVYLVRKSNSEFVFEAEYDNGDVTRSVMRKVKRERKKKAKE
jgi:hypothetical protein